MELLHIDLQKCTQCGICVDACPFGTLSLESYGIAVGENCRLCGACIQKCPVEAIRRKTQENTVDKDLWKDFLIFVEQEQGRIHPVALELIGEAQKMAKKVGYRVNCVIIGGVGTTDNAHRLLPYGVDKVYAYEHPALEGFLIDSYTRIAADCIEATHPSSVLIGATALGRSLAPRLSTRFHTGLTADCTTLDIKPNTDLVQIRPAFGGNVMAQIAITRSRPQFATVRYRVMDRAKRIDHPQGKVICRTVSEALAATRVRILSHEVIRREKRIEEEDILVVAGRGARNEEGVRLCERLAKALGARLAFTRPMVENGYGDQQDQIGLSGHTVKPRLIITCGVSGAIQFTACMNDADCIVAINNDPEAQIFDIAHYCVKGDLFAVLPRLAELAENRKEE